MPPTSSLLPLLLLLGSLSHSTCTAIKASRKDSLSVMVQNCHNYKSALRIPVHQKSTKPLILHLTAPSGPLTFSPHAFRAARLHNVPLNYVIGAACDWTSRVSRNACRSSVSCFACVDPSRRRLTVFVRPLSGNGRKKKPARPAAAGRLARLPTPFPAERFPIRTCKL